MVNRLSNVVCHIKCAQNHLKDALNSCFDLHSPLKSLFILITTNTCSLIKMKANNLKHRLNFVRLLCLRFISAYYFRAYRSKERLGSWDIPLFCVNEIGIYTK